MVTGAPLDLSDEWGVLLFQVLLVAAPFALLARAGLHTPAAWGAAFVVTLIFWGLLIASAVAAQRDGTGANIGMGLLMLVSPVFVAGAGFLAQKIAIWAGADPRPPA